MSFCRFKLSIVLILIFLSLILCFTPKLNSNNGINRINKEKLKDQSISRSTLPNLYNESQNNNKLIKGEFTYSVEKEIINGRFAMLGLVAGLGREYITGESIWTQMGIMNEHIQDSILLLLFGVFIAGLSAKLASLKETAIWG